MAPVGASTTDEKSRPRSDGAGASCRAYRSPLARQQLHHPNRMAGTSRGRDARLLVGVVLLVPTEIRRLFTILMIIGAVWVVGAATVFTVILIRTDQ
jgi:hypothetical protein